MPAPPARWVTSLAAAAAPVFRSLGFDLRFSSHLPPQRPWRRSCHHRSCRSWCRHWNRFWLSHSLGVSQSNAFEATLWVRHLRLCPLRGDGTLCPLGGIRNPLCVLVFRKCISKRIHLGTPILRLVYSVAVSEDSPYRCEPAVASGFMWTAWRSSSLLLV